MMVAGESTHLPHAGQRARARAQTLQEGVTTPGRGREPATPWGIARKATRADVTAILDLIDNCERTQPGHCNGGRVLAGAHAD